MESITLDGATYPMTDIYDMKLIWNDETTPGHWQISVTFAGGTIEYLEMTTENVASLNAWIAHGRTYIPKSSRKIPGRK